MGKLIDRRLVLACKTPGSVTTWVIDFSRPYIDARNTEAVSGMVVSDQVVSLYAVA